MCQAPQPARDREDGQDDEGDPHGERSLVGVVVDGGDSRPSEEGHDEQARHVEGGEDGRGEPDPEEDGHAVVGAGEDRVLRVEAGEEGQPGDREHADQEGRPGHRELLPEPAHAAHVLLVVAGVDHRTGPQEHEGLEEGVRRQVEEGRVPRSDAEPEEHVPELADGRVGQDLLDVVLGQGDEPAHQGGDGPQDGHDQEHLGREHEHEAAEEVHAGGHHGRGVNQRADGRGTLHGVREPDVEAELRALARGPGDEPERGDDEPGALERAGRDRLPQGADVEGTDLGVDDHEGQEEAQIPDPRRDEGLAGGVGRRLLLGPEPDELVGAEADQLPSDDEEEQVVGEHQQQHRDGEHLQPGEEEGVLLVAVHVADAEEVHEERDEAHHDEHHGGEPVDGDPDGQRGRVDTERAEPGPAPLVRRRVAEHLQGDQDRADEGDADREDGEEIPAPEDASSEEVLQQEPEHRGEEADERERQQRHGPTPSSCRCGPRSHGPSHRRRS